MALYTSHENLLYIVGLLNSALSQKYLGIFNEGLNYNQGDIAKIPVIQSATGESAAQKEVSELVSLSKKDWDSYETSWDFKRNPLV